MSRLSASRVLLEVDDEHLRAALARDQADALADRTGAEHHDPLAGRTRSRGSPPGPRSTPARQARPPRGHRPRSGTPAPGRHGQQLLQAAVDVDPDQLEVVARVRAPDAARVALPAREQRPQRDPAADHELRAAVGPDAPRSWRRPRGPGCAGTAIRRRRRTARRGRSGSPSRRSRPPRGARRPRPGPGTSGSGRSTQRHRRDALGHRGAHSVAPALDVDLDPHPVGIAR